MKTTFSFCKFAIILTFFLSFTIASAVGVSLLDVSVNGSSFLPGSSIEIDYVVHYNCISIRDRSFTLEAYASSDSTITSSDIYLGSESCTVDVGSGELSDTMTGYFPMDIPQGEYYIGIIHYTDSVYDSSPVTVEAAIYPDLTLTSVGILDSDPLIPGGMGRVECTVENIGDFKSGDFYVNLYVSEDTTITSDDYGVAHSHPGSLAPGESTDITRTFYLPDDIPPGDYYIGGIVECSYDSDPENNSYCGDSFSVITAVDIGVQEVSVSPDICIPGGSINVTVTVENFEQAALERYTVNYYASTDCRTTYYLGSLERSSLAAGEKETFDRLCQLPEDIPQGYYYIGVKLDYQEDTNQENNEGWSYYIWIGQCTDLAVEAVDVNNPIHLPGEQLTVYSLIKNIGGRASEPYTVNYYASSDITIDGQDYFLCSVSRNGLNVGEQHSYNTSFEFPKNYPEGNFYIGIIVTCLEEYDKTNNIGYCDSMMELSSPDGYVCGQVKYRCTRDSDEPVRYALVEIYDNQNTATQLDDLIIGRTHTDHNGIYGVVVSDNGPGNNEIYVKVFTKGCSGAYPGTSSIICYVRDEEFDETYFSESSLYPHPQDASVVINMTAVGEVGPFLVYDSVVEGFHKAKTFFDIEMEEVMTYWPNSYGNSFFAPGYGIFISEDDKSDRDVIMHEYGHYVAQVCNFTQGSVGENSAHYWNEDLRFSPVERNNEEAGNLAFRESWATLFSIATQYGDIGYPYAGDSKYQDYDAGYNYTFEIDLEKGTKAHNSPGQYYENMNTCALWDIFDDNCCKEDNLDVFSDTSLSQTWSVFVEHKPEDIVDFWNGWLQLYNSQDGIREIFLDHEMDFVE